MTNIKGVGFDYGGVLGGNPNLGNYFTEQNAQLLGITPETWRSTYFSMNNLLNTGALSNKKDFWKLFLSRFNQVDKLARVLALDEELSDKYIAVNQDMLRLVGRLRSAGYKVGLLSNATEEVANKIKSLKLAKHFDSFLFSIDIGYQKPDVKAFAELAKSLEVKINELAFIDDATKSLVNAAGCGFTPILFKSQAQLENDLHKLGLTY